MASKKYKTPELKKEDPRDLPILNEWEILRIAKASYGESLGVFKPSFELIQESKIKMDEIAMRVNQYMPLVRRYQRLKKENDELTRRLIALEGEKKGGKAK